MELAIVSMTMLPKSQSQISIHHHSEIPQNAHELYPRCSLKVTANVFIFTIQERINSKSNHFMRLLELLASSLKSSLNY
jgi:hypothetical protein